MKSGKSLFDDSSIINCSNFGELNQGLITLNWHQEIKGFCITLFPLQEGGGGLKIDPSPKEENRESHAIFSVTLYQGMKVG